MTSLAIGIPVHAEPQRLLATLESVRARTPGPFELWLLPDGPDAATRMVLGGLSDIPQLATDTQQGTPACFNRLLAATSAAAVVLLESGALVGARWMEGLLAALREPRHGLAGPSTNASWNEQDLVRHPAARPLLSPLLQGSARPLQQFDVDRLADAVAQRLGGMVQGLEPLHSLSDFCYAVRRDVIEAVGAADEGYGGGPCWEMDYNIRAARAGFRGVWACGSYVHRSPFTRRRAADEQRLMEASKRRYQETFCGRRRAGVPRAFASHCLGDACPDFAPPDRIRIHAPLPAAAKCEIGAAAAVSSATMPLASCIMPTANRRDFVLQSIKYFQRQDYVPRELIILDDEGGEDLTALLPDDDRIRYVRLPLGRSIGAKRNHGCTLARGRYLAQWDDDDCYAPSRLRVQLAPLLAGSSDITALSAGVFFELPNWRFWRVSAELHRRMFVGDVHGGTLVFDRALFDRGLRYSDRSLAEDAWFLWQATRTGARLQKLPGEEQFVYLRHGQTSWSFACGTFLDPVGWLPATEPALIAANRDFYANLGTGTRAGAPAARVALGRTGPLVTCIMPTAGRRSLVPQSIRYFQRQDYAARELLVIDDGADPVADLIPDDPRIRYVRLDRPISLGAKRNEACEAAHGDLILHWDDDDWMAPWRVSLQSEALQAHPRAGACGLASLYYFDPAGAMAWLYTQPSGMRPWVSGNTLCYRRAVWDRHRFPDINEGEDTVFVWSLAEHEVMRLAAPDLCVALLHAGNTSQKRTHHPGWRAIPKSLVGALLQDDLRFYEAWAAASAAAPQP